MERNDNDDQADEGEFRNLLYDLDLEPKKDSYINDARSEFSSSNASGSVTSLATSNRAMSLTRKYAASPSASTELQNGDRADPWSTTIDLRPVGALEQFQVDTIIHADWQRRRLKRIEANLYRTLLSEGALPKKSIPSSSATLPPANSCLKSARRSLRSNPPTPERSPNSAASAGNARSRCWGG